MTSASGVSSGPAEYLLWGSGGLCDLWDSGYLVIPEVLCVATASSKAEGFCWNCGLRYGDEEVASLGRKLTISEVVLAGAYPGFWLQIRSL